MKPASGISRQVNWAHETRAKLLRILGASCKYCGVTNNLTFDCIRPTGGKHHKLSSVNRMSFYMGQFRAGNLQVLCHSCNTKKSDKPQDRYLPGFAPSLLPPA